MNISYAVCQSAKFQQAFKTAIASSAGILFGGGGIGIGIEIDSVQIVSTTLVQSVSNKFPYPDVVVKYIVKFPMSTNKTLAAEMLYANITDGYFVKVLDKNGFHYVKSKAPVIDLSFSFEPTTRPTSLPSAFDTFSVTQVTN